MRTIVWQSLSETQQDSVLERPAIAEGANITAAVAEVIAKVRAEGDSALLELTEKFDKCKPESIRVSAEEIDAACERLDDEMKQALEVAYNNITKFHKAQKPAPIKVETMPGVVCEQVTRAINKVGLYTRNSVGGLWFEDAVNMITVVDWWPWCSDGRCNVGSGSSDNRWRMMQVDEVQVAVSQNL